MNGRKAPARLIVVDDHDVARLGLIAILTGVPGLRVVAEARDAAGAISATRAHTPDLVLLDVRMPGESGPAVLPRILALSETIAVILMTAVPQVRTAVDAMKAGAYDYVIKPFEPD